MKNINTFRLCMLGATVFSCGLAAIFTIPVWIVGEIINLKEN